MSKYVPPSKRSGYISPTSSTLPPGHRKPFAPRSYQVSQIANQFNHGQSSTVTFFNIRQKPSPRLSWPEYYDPSRTPDNIPLPPSPPPPPPIHPLSYLISYVIIFPGAHPAWIKEDQLWMHTNADTLIEDSRGGRKNFGRPIPVFGGSHGRENSMVFQGWYLIDKLEVVEAASDELVRMLKIKEDAKGESSFRYVGYVEG